LIGDVERMLRVQSQFVKIDLNHYMDTLECEGYSACMRGMGDVPQPYSVSACAAWVMCRSHIVFQHVRHGSEARFNGENDDGSNLQSECVST
jgi:hypothetical protein